MGTYLFSGVDPDELGGKGLVGKMVLLNLTTMDAWKPALGVSDHLDRNCRKNPAIVQNLSTVIQRWHLFRLQLEDGQMVVARSTNSSGIANCSPLGPLPIQIRHGAKKSRLDGKAKELTDGALTDLSEVEQTIVLDPNEK